MASPFVDNSCNLFVNNQLERSEGSHVGCILARTSAAPVLRRRPSQSDPSLTFVFPSHPVLSEQVKIVLLNFRELIAELSPGHFRQGVRGV